MEQNSPEINAMDPDIRGQLIFYKDVKVIQWRRDNSSRVVMEKQICVWKEVCLNPYLSPYANINSMYNWKL